MKAMLSLLVAAAIALGAGTAGAYVDYYHYQPGGCFQFPPTDSSVIYLYGKAKVSGATSHIGYCPMETENLAHHADNLLQVYIYTYQYSSSYTPYGRICARNGNGNDDTNDIVCVGDNPVSTGNNVNSYIFFGSDDAATIKAAASYDWPLWTEITLSGGNSANRVTTIFEY